MPTKPQVEEKLRSLDYDGFLVIAEKLRIRRDRYLNMTDQEWREHWTDWILSVYDNPDWDKKVLLLRALTFPTDEESHLNMQVASTDAAIRSATTAEQALEAAERSATAAEKSETHARSSTKAAWLTVVLTLIAVAVAVLALLKSYHVFGGK